MPGHKTVKTILNKRKGPRDLWLLDDYTVNPYSGCSFNCLYCYIRGGRYDEHMEEKLSVKTKAAELLDKQLKLRAGKGEYSIIVLSSATDPYLQFEEELQLTRRLLEVILKHRFPVHIITRSDLVTRDYDLLHAINDRAIIPSDLLHKTDQIVFVTFSFTTVDDAVAKIFEPGATPPSQRLQTLRKIVSEGFLPGVSMMPLLPYISDTTDSLNRMFTVFKEAGTHYVMPWSITLFGGGPGDSRTLVLRAVEKQYPSLHEKYKKLFAQSHELPAYYNDAFYKKMGELGADYQLRNRII